MFAFLGGVGWGGTLYHYIAVLKIVLQIRKCLRELSFLNIRKLDASQIQGIR